MNLGPFVPPQQWPSPILIIGEAPGGEEESSLMNFVGPSGHLLNETLRKVGLSRDGIPTCNVVCHRPPNNEINHFITRNRNLAKKTGMLFSERLKAYAQPWVDEHIDILTDTIRKVNPNVILALGNTPLWALCGVDGITNWRGSILESRICRPDGKPYKVIPSLHPAAILRQYPWLWPFQADLRRVKKESLSPCIDYPKWEFTIEPTFEQVESMLVNFLGMLGVQPIETSIDIETTRRQISCIGLSTGDRTALCIPFIDRRRQDGNYWDAPKELTIVKLLRETLRHPNLRAIGQNFGYDKVYLRRNWGVLPPTYIDTQTYHHTNWALLPKKISYQASLFCRYYKYWKDEGKQKEDKKDWGAKTPDRTLWEYNCKDVCYTYEVAQVQKKNAEVLGMTRKTITLASGLKLSPVEFQMALDIPSVTSTLKGVNIDKKVRRELTAEMVRELTLMQARFERLVGHPLNTNSYPQMKRFFIDDLRQKAVLGEEGNPTFAEEALITMAKREPLLRPLVDLITNLRSGNLFHNTFLKAELLNGRFHCGYNRDGTATYRFSSSDDPMGYGGNGQNIPKGMGKLAYIIKANGGRLTLKALHDIVGGDLDKLRKKVLDEEQLGLLLQVGKFPDVTLIYQFGLPNVRKMFIPNEGHVIGSWDLVGADHQVVTWLACEFDPCGPTQEMKQHLREKRDTHEVNMALLGIDRDSAKRFIHLTNYGGKPRKAAESCGITVHEAEKHQRRYFQARPGVKRWHEDVDRQLKTTFATGRPPNITSRFGFRFYFHDRPESLLTKALATEPQHTIAIVINAGWLNVWQQAPDIDILMQVHDELVPQTKNENLEEKTARLKSLLAVTVPFDDPLVIPVSGGWSEKSWADAKG